MEKIWLIKNNHKIELENLGNVWVVWEYGGDELQDSLELKHYEVEDFIETWEGLGYHIQSIETDGMYYQENRRRTYCGFQEEIVKNGMIRGEKVG